MKLRLILLTSLCGIATMFLSFTGAMEIHPEYQALFGGLYALLIALSITPLSVKVPQKIIFVALSYIVYYTAILLKGHIEARMIHDEVPMSSPFSASFYPPLISGLYGVLLFLPMFHFLINKLKNLTLSICLGFVVALLAVAPVLTHSIGLNLFVFERIVVLFIWQTGIGIIIALGIKKPTIS